MTPIHIPVAVNWHVWPRCNYRCRFCFATFADVPRALSKDLALKVPALLHEAGTRKITLAGGEPTLCPHLGEVLRACKGAGMTTRLVTNASRLTDDFLGGMRGLLDWVTISVDSAQEAVESELGRGLGNHVWLARRAARAVQFHGFHLKVNTVVTSRNWGEVMHGLILEMGPERWKVLQMLPIAGGNIGGMDLSIVASQFRSFLRRHRDLDPVGEDNDAMTGSYVMLDPLGRFFQNTEGRYTYSRSILDVGVGKALDSVGWDRGKFLERGGLYSWAPSTGRRAASMEDLRRGVAGW